MSYTQLPNILIVMTDQQRADLRKSRGFSLETTPFLDEWSKEGMDFERAYSPNPTCIPARVSMFTGRYASCHHVRTNHNTSDATYTRDLLDIVKSMGYQTALCGKNHSQHTQEDFDFAMMNMHLGNECGEDRTDEEHIFGEFLRSTRHMESHRPSPLGVTVQHPYRNVSDALDFMDTRDKERPFFAWVSFAEPHNPYQVPEPYFDMFPPEHIPAINTNHPDIRAAKGFRYQWIRRIWEGIMDKDIEARMLRARSNYYGMLRLIDDQFKRLINGMEERGLSENTIVLYLSDHGDFAGEYGLIRKGADLPEVLTRIPMVWKGPGILPMGLQNTACVSIIDILPTICSLLGVDIPFGCQGRSMIQLLRAKDDAHGEFQTAYMENGYGGLYWTEEDVLDPNVEGATSPGEQTRYKTFDCLNSWSQCGHVRALRSGDMKLQIDMMGNGYLYDLTVDPLEINNLWGNPGYMAAQASLLKDLAVASMRASDPLPAPRKRYRLKQDPQGHWDSGFQSLTDPGVIGANTEYTGRERK